MTYSNTVEYTTLKHLELLLQSGKRLRFTAPFSSCTIDIWHQQFVANNPAYLPVLLELLEDISVTEDDTAANHYVGSFASLSELVRELPLNLDLFELI